jgi:CHAT domain-containing protein
MDYSFKKVLPGIRSDIICASNGTTYFLKNKELTKLSLTNNSNVELSITGNIITSQANGIYGLANIPINEYERGVAVLTDLGFSFYHENHFEHFYLPGKEKAKGLVNGADQNFAGWSDRGVWVFEKDQAQVIEGSFSDILSVNELGLTFVADGGSLKYIFHRNDSSIASNSQLKWGIDIVEHDYYGNTNALALDSKNRLIANDGQFIKRYTWDADAQVLNEENLFHANQFEPTSGEKYQAGGVKNIVVAKDGTIWVATKMSVFRYREQSGGEPIIQEYNYFRDQSRFPAPTHMIYRIFETNDGRIRVVASDEKHLYYQGASLKGGFMEWSPEEEKFVLLNTDNLDYSWVVHSYTPISENEAIIGTTNGFARDKNGYTQHFGYSLKSPSYLELAKKHPNVFLGTRGAKIGDLWVFGSGAGVVAYHQDRWFYPDRLNQLLPKDLELQNYGSRHVNAIDVDANGRLYIGTDLGLLILDGQGDAAASFLLENDTPDKAFEFASVETVMAESELILSDLKLPDVSSKLVDQIKMNQAEVARIERLLSGNQPNRTMVTPPKDRIDSLNSLITNKQKEHVELLLKLETSDPAIHQLLSIKPVEIASLRKRFKPDQCVVQYIPTKQRLYIQVLSQTQAVLREVKISQDSLMRMCQGVSNLLKHEVEGEVLINKLAGLYDMLLRPISEEIREYEHVQVIPVMSMYYVPFSALINKKSSSDYKYAVEEHHFGYVSSTNLLSLIMENPEREQKGVLLMGDADGSLPAAREEVKEINKLVTNGTILIGGEVTLANLLKNTGNASIIHLATHGFLNEKIPSKSNILLAQDKRLSLPEAFNLPLDQTDMVVLSACETGKGGGSGLEYATMARAFTNAGASTVLATLWKVNDKATKELMVKFYGYLAEGDDKFTALAKAQRELLASGDEDLIHPNRWASFVVMGEP